MLKTRSVKWLFLAGMIVFGVGAVSGQNYPNRPIRVITSEAGGGNDLTSRVIAQALTDSLGQQVIVDNRGGASGIIAAQIVANAPPDGYTLFFYNDALWILPLMQSVPYDPVKDFSPVTVATKATIFLVVHPAVPVTSVRELIALAKAKPGALNYSIGGAGSTPHLATELFKVMAGVDIQRIPYKGGGPALNALVGGQVQLMFATGGAVPHIKAGRLRALAVTTAEPSALAPGLPTVAASNLPGYEAAGLVAVFAPPKTPAKLIDRLNQEIVRVLNRADVKEKFFNVGVETVGSSPMQLASLIKSDMVKWAKVIKDAGIRSE